MRSASAARVLVFIVLSIGAVELGSRPGPSLARAGAPEGWRQEFEDVCSKTQDAMVLSTDELKRLVARCDGLKPAIEALGDAERKVYSRRLQACRDLYQFVLDYREQGGST